MGVMRGQGPPSSRRGSLVPSMVRRRQAAESRPFPICRQPLLARLVLVFLGSATAGWAQTGLPREPRQSWRQTVDATMDRWGQPSTSGQRRLLAGLRADYQHAAAASDGIQMVVAADRMLGLHLNSGDWRAAQEDLVLLDSGRNVAWPTGGAPRESDRMEVRRATVVSSRQGTGSAYRYCWDHGLSGALGSRLGMTAACIAVMLTVLLVMPGLAPKRRKLQSAMTLLALIPAASWLIAALRPVFSDAVYGSPLAYQVQTQAWVVTGYLCAAFGIVLCSAMVWVGTRRLHTAPGYAADSDNPPDRAERSSQPLLTGRLPRLAVAIALAVVIQMPNLSWESVTHRPYLSEWPGWHQAIWALYFAGVAPLCEELVFRRRLFGSLRHHIGPLHAGLFSACLYAGMYGASWAWPIHAWYGVVLAYEYELTGSVALCVLTHALAAAFVLVGVR